MISRIRETDAELTLVLKEDYRQIGKRSIADIKSDVQTRLRAITVPKYPFPKPEEVEAEEGVVPGI